MRPCTAALSVYLAASNFEAIIVDLFTFSLVTGETLRYSGGNTALTLAAANFPDPNSLNYGAAQTFALGPRFGRSKVTTKVGVEPAELDIDVLAGAADLVGTFPFADAVRLGIFDGATVELDRLFAPPQPLPSQGDGAGALAPLGCLTWFYGRVAECDVGRSKITMKVKSLMNLLAVQQMPRRIYMASCTFVFGDPMCGYNRVSGASQGNGPSGPSGPSTGPGQITVTAAAGSTQAVVICTAPPNATWYPEGTMIGLAGANAGYTRSIAAISGTSVSVPKAWLYPVNPGDTFYLQPGCDHTLTGANGCQAKNNMIRFGGMPYIPPPEQAY
jgi:hypothetical protein